MDIVCWYIGNAAKNNKEHQRSKDGLNKMPERPENGLLVLCREIALYKQYQQIAVAPYIF